MFNAFKKKLKDQFSHNNFLQNMMFNQIKHTIMSIYKKYM